MSNGQPLSTKIYRGAIYVAAVVLVLLAIFFSVARVLLNDLGKYRGVIEQEVSKLLDQNVHIQGFDARLEGMTPVLIFKDVQLLNSKTKRELARFSEARIGLAVLASIRERQFVPGEITINGIHIILTRHKNGSLSVQGLKVNRRTGNEPSKTDNQLAQWLFTYSDLSLENSTIVWQDNLKTKHYQFNDVNLHLTNRGQRHVLAGQVEVPKTLGRNVKFSADVNGDSLNPQDWQGTFYLQAFAVDIQQWEQFQPRWNNAQLKNGQLDVRLWGKWGQSKLLGLSGDLSAYDVTLQEKKAGPLNLQLLAGIFDWQRGEQGWSMKVKDFQLIHGGSVWPKTDITLAYQPGVEDVFQLNAGYLRIEDLRTILDTLDEGPEDLRQAVNGLNPSGDLRNLAAKAFVRDHKLRDVAVHAAFSHLHTSAWRHYPAIQGFRGSLVSTLNYGQLKIDNSYSTIYFPKMFRHAFSLNELKTQISWSKDRYGWTVSAGDVATQTTEVKANASVYLQVPANKASPYLDMQVQFWDGDASNASTYYPVGIMDKDLVHWLDQAIVAGKVGFGGAVFSGRLNDFPFRQQQGNFQVQFYADQVELNYQKHWPPLTNARVDASFSGQSMHIHGIQAQLLQQTLSRQVDVDIKDFLHPELQVQAKASGPVKEVFDFLVNSPIAPESKHFVQSVAMSGKSELNLDLYIPLNNQMAKLNPLHYRGDVDLTNMSFALLDRAVDIRALNGKLKFDERGLSGQALKASIMGEPASLDVYTQDFKEARPVQIVGRGAFDAATLHSHFAIPGLEKLSGQAGWQGVFTLPYVQAGREIPARLSLSSDLQGVTMDLPAPLNKKAGDKTPFSMTVVLPAKGMTQVQVQYDHRLQAALGLSRKQGSIGVSKATVNFGKKMPVLPRRKILRLEGNATQLPVQDWLEYFSAKGRHKTATAHDWQAMPVELAMNRLQLMLNADEHNTPLSKGGGDIRPQQWPLVNGYINKLMVNNTEIGKVVMDIDRVTDGFRINQLNLSTPYSTITSRGSWQFRQKEKTSLKIDMTSNDLGSQLSQWGFAAIIKAGKVRNTHAEVNWPASPFGFSFAGLNGRFNARIEKGNIVEVDPGAGRLFGLLSLAALPRRLFLDFTDMKSGFSFDTVEGSFDISQGNATTKNLTVDSTLAKVIVDGRTGLAQQDYDLNVLVIPNISGTAPLPGYLVWGPQVGAVLLFLKQIFGSAFDKSVASAYQITGSWEKPNIEKLNSPAPATK